MVRPKHECERGCTVLVEHIICLFLSLHITKGNVMTMSSTRVGTLLKEKKGSTKQREKACYCHPIDYSNPLFKLFVKHV